MLQYFIIIGEGGGGGRRWVINRLERDLEGWGGDKNRRFKDFIFGEQRFAKYGF